MANGQTGRGGTIKPTNTNRAPTIPTQSMSANMPQPITKPTAVNKFVLGNFHKLINNQPIAKDVCVKTDNKQNHPTCDPVNFQDIILHKDISQDMKRTLLFFHLHSKGCLVCAHITNIHEKSTPFFPIYASQGKMTATYPQIVPCIARNY